MKPLNGQIHHQYIWTLVNTLALSSSYYPFLKGTGLDQKGLFWLLSLKSVGSLVWLVEARRHTSRGLLWSQLLFLFPQVLARSLE